MGNKASMKNDNDEDVEGSPQSKKTPRKRQSQDVDAGESPMRPAKNHEMKGNKATNSNDHTQQVGDAMYVEKSEDDECTQSMNESQDMIPDSMVTSEADATPGATQSRCTKCAKRNAREGCTQDACLQCCNDDGCEKHKKAKEQAILKQQILDGTTDIQVMANRIRSKVIPKKRFREKGFRYACDTVVVWNVREYFQNPKWKDDALRKCARRTARASPNKSQDKSPGNISIPSANRISRKKAFVATRKERFYSYFEQLYRRSSPLPTKKADTPLQDVSKNSRGLEGTISFSENIDGGLDVGLEDHRQTGASNNRKHAPKEVLSVTNGIQSTKGDILSEKEIESLGAAESGKIGRKSPLITSPVR